MDQEKTEDVRQLPLPYVTNIEQLTKENSAYRRVIWTGSGMQLVVMHIDEMGEIPLERHENEDQFIRLESGRALVMMGKSQNDLTEQWMLEEDDIAIIPKGYYHYVKNLTTMPLKLYTIYAPAHHPEALLQLEVDK